MQQRLHLAPRVQCPPPVPIGCSLVARQRRLVRQCVWLAWLVVFSLGCLSACRASSSPQPTAEAVAQAQAEALVAQARQEVAEASPEGGDRWGGLFVPPNLKGPRPLLVFLHGLGGSGQGMVERLHLKAWASLKQFVLLAPEGATNFSGRQYWNATASCCDFEGKGLDHIGLLRQWLGRARALPQVDGNRVYLVGFSNGGYLAHRAACELGGMLRGIVSIAGAGPGPSEHCSRSKPLSVIQIHGSADPIVAYEGGYLFADKRRPAHPSAEQSVAGWAGFNGCGNTAVALRHLNLDERLPGAETTVLGYPGCQEHPVQLWRIEGGDHSSGLSRRSVDAVWQFVEAQG